MNSKLERYYDYIVNDILDDTIIDMDKRFYRFPFIREFNIKWNMDVIDLTKPVTSSQTIKSLFANFFKYVENNYGVKPEESTHIWKRYIDKLPK